MNELKILKKDYKENETRENSKKMLLKMNRIDKENISRKKNEERLKKLNAK